jgi:hypothetical protein
VAGDETVPFSGSTLATEVAAWDEIKKYVPSAPPSMTIAKSAREREDSPAMSDLKLLFAASMLSAVDLFISLIVARC